MRARKMNNVINVMLQVAAECEAHKSYCGDCLYRDDKSGDCLFKKVPEYWNIAGATEKWRGIGLMNHWGKYGHDKGGE